MVKWKKNRIIHTRLWKKRIIKLDNWRYFSFVKKSQSEDLIIMNKTRLYLWKLNYKWMGFLYFNWFLYFDSFNLIQSFKKPFISKLFIYWVNLKLFNFSVQFFAPFSELSPSLISHLPIIKNSSNFYNDHIFELFI